jgi:hypothetical protein
VATELDGGELEALLPLALGHDQEASACPWVQLTRRTADYPSRKAQAALAFAGDVVPATPDLVDQLYRCDGCGRCRAWSTLTRPLDLARTLWRVRASMVAAGAVPEVASLAEPHRTGGSVYGDLGPALARLGPSNAGADVLFVPGGATLHHAPKMVEAALGAARMVKGRVAFDRELVDSGQELLELGLADEAGSVRDALRRRVVEAGYRSVLAGTPKEAFGLREALVGLSVEVRYVGTALATVSMDERMALPAIEGDGPVVFHPSESLLHRLDEFDAIDRWLMSWLGDRYRPEVEPRRNAWPAAIERLAPRVPSQLKRSLAERRLTQLFDLLGTRRRGVILTSDPWSWRALREVAPPEIEVRDLLVAAGGGRPDGAASRGKAMEIGDEAR